MTAPLMPKATAVLLVENTTLTFRQIGNFCELHELEVQAIADGDVALAETPDAAPVVEETDETLAPKADIEDAAVALASGNTVNDEAKKMNWWWILIVALLGVTGKKMYEEHMRKEEEKNKNKID